MRWPSIYYGLKSVPPQYQPSAHLNGMCPRCLYSYMYMYSVPRCGYSIISEVSSAHNVLLVRGKGMRETVLCSTSKSLQVQ